MVSDVHSIASGSGLHISVTSHVTIVTADTYPASHWMVTVDPGNLHVGDWSKGSIRGVGHHRTVT